MADLKSLYKEFKLDTNLSFDIRYADDTTIMSVFLEARTQLKNFKLPGYENQLLQILGHFIREFWKAMYSRLWESSASWVAQYHLQREMLVNTEP